MFKGVSNWAPYWQFHFREGGGGVHCLPILGLNMNVKESIVFMFKVHLPHAQATGNCAISILGGGYNLR